MCHKYIFFLKTDVNCPLFWILKMELFVFYEWQGEEKQERWFWFVGRHHDIKEDEALYKGALKSSKNVVIDNNTPPHKAHNGQSMMYGNPQNRFPDWLHLALSSGPYCDSGGDHLLSDNIMAHSPHTSHSAVWVSAIFWTCVQESSKCCLIMITISQDKRSRPGSGEERGPCNECVDWSVLPALQPRFIQSVPGRELRWILSDPTTIPPDDMWPNFAKYRKGEREIVESCLTAVFRVSGQV